MITREEVIEIGTFGKTHGVKGEISAVIDCENELFKQFSCIICSIDGILVPFFITALRDKNRASVLITLEGIDSEDTAQTLVNKDIYVLKAEYASLSEEAGCDELPIDYFIGFDAYNDDGARIGEITDIDDATDNVLFIVSDGDNDYAIPAIDDLITDIDEQARHITFSLPEGLLDI